MIYNFQGITLTLPFKWIVSLEELQFIAEINEHPKAYFTFLVEEEYLEEEIHNLQPEAGVEIDWQDTKLFCGKIFSANRIVKHSLSYLHVVVVGYTIEWDLVKKNRTFCREKMTYEQLQGVITSTYPYSYTIDCVSDEQVIPQFLLQYEESDWEFLKRIATHFATCIIPNTAAGFPCAFFGIPEGKNRTVLKETSYSYVRDMETYLKLSGSERFLPQDTTKWMVITDEIQELGDDVILNGVTTVVTGMYLYVFQGEVVSAYELSRRSGLVHFYQQNPLIYGMSLPATVKSRKDNQLQVHFDIDETYEDFPDNHYFTYAIESSKIRSIPTEGSRVHIYFPSHIEQEAIAVHAIRSEGVPAARKKQFLPAPEYKAFSDSNGSQVFFHPGAAGFVAGDNAAYVNLGAQGPIQESLYVIGDSIQILSDGDIYIGGSESSSQAVVLGGASVQLTVGPEDGQTINFVETLQLKSANTNFWASGKGAAERTPPVDYGAIYTSLTDRDMTMIDRYNEGAVAELEARLRAAKELKIMGVLVIGEVAIVAALAIFVPLAGAAIAASKLTCGVLLVSGSGQVAIGISYIQEGDSAIENIMGGSFKQGDNFLRDFISEIGGNESLYKAFCTANGIVFNVATAQFINGIPFEKFGPLMSMCGKRQNAVTMFHVGKNVIRGAVRDFAIDGTFNPARLLCDATLGLVQGAASNLIGGAITRVVGGGAVTYVVANTFADTLMDYGYHVIQGVEFDWGMSITLNLLANSAGMLIQEPVDAVSGAYYINSEELIITGICLPVALRRSYLSTNQAVGSMGRGWRFSYDSRIYYDEKGLHMDVPTGHKLMFGMSQEEGQHLWKLASTGCDWFTLTENKAVNGHRFCLEDQKTHTRYHYDEAGYLIEEQNAQGQAKRFVYDKTGLLEKIMLSEGCCIEFEWQNGKIVSIQDWTGRCLRYEYDNEYLVKVTHVDDGVCTYSYDEAGYLHQVTSQTGSVYLTNYYDPNGRIIRQELANGEYYEMNHDARQRMVTSYYSGRESTEKYSYDRDHQVIQAEYSDGTSLVYQYNDRQYRISETNRRGITTQWGYDELGRRISEERESGYRKQWIYNEKNDLICELDSGKRETLYEYDEAHNCIRMREKVSGDSYRTTEWNYDSYGRVLLLRDGNGGETTYQYHGMMSGPDYVTNPMKEKTGYIYDAIGRRQEVQNSYGTAFFGYTRRNYLASYTNGEEETYRYLYDQMGKLHVYYPPRSWDGERHPYQYGYDFMARQNRIITPEGDRYDMLLNGEGDILREIHPNAHGLEAEEKPGIIYEYDGDGNQIRIRYSDGGCERRFYDGEGNLTKRVEPEYYEEASDDGAGYTYTYDEENRMIQSCNPDGQVTANYGYGSDRNVIRVWDDTGKDICFGYDGLGNQTQMWERVDEDNYQVTCYDYDPYGNKVKERYGKEVTQLWELPAAYHEVCFTYDANHRLIQVKDEYGACIRYKYDCLGNVLQEQKRICGGNEQEGEVWQKIWYRYDKGGRRIEKKQRIEGTELPPHQRFGKEKTASFAITSYQYDKNGNLSRITTPNGHQIIREYDLSDRLISEHTIDKLAGIDRTLNVRYDHAGNVIELSQSGQDLEPLTYTYHYDYKNRLIEKETPDRGSWQYQYDKNDRSIMEGFEKEPLSYQTYDSQGNVLELKNGLGELVERLNYDAAGRLCHQSNGEGGEMHISYTADGREKQIHQGEQIRQEYQYSAGGHISGITDGNQNQTRFETDGWGKITKVIHADGSEEAYSYNAAGLVTDTIDGNGNQICYTYNSLGKVSCITDQLGESEYFYYDLEGNLTESIDRNGNRVLTTYNVDGNILMQKAVDSQGFGEITSLYDYDSLGRIKKAISGGMCYTYEYAAQGRLKRKRAGGKTLLAYTYCKDGQLSQMVDVSGKAVSYRYDLLRRLEKIQDETGKPLVSYFYDPQDRVKKITYGTGITTLYDYDADGNISHLRTVGLDESGNEGQVFQDYHYQYDGNGNRTAKEGLVWAGSDDTRQENIRFIYDRKNQLVEESYGNQRTRYDYDPAGNRIWQEKDGESFVFTYNQKSQLTAKRGDALSYYYHYDKQGSLTEELCGDQKATYHYDSLNRQTEVIKADGTFQTNRYDAEGLRAEMEENERLCRFIFHKREIVSEERTDDQQPIRYIRGYGAEYLEQDGKSYCIQKDEQNSTVFLLDRNHEIQSSYSYDGFGDFREQSGGQIENRILYTGQQYDSTTKFYYLRARYYDPRLGRFMQEDPYRGDGLNLYAYCANNPVMYYDPSGYASTPANPDCPPGSKFATGNGEPQTDPRLNLTKKELAQIETLRNGGEVQVDSYKEARRLIENMPELRPATEEGIMPNPTGRMSDGFADPPGTYRGDLINKHPTLNDAKNMGLKEIDPMRIPVHPDVDNKLHANNPHYNIKLPDGNKAAIIIRVGD